MRAVGLGIDVGTDSLKVALVENRSGDVHVVSHSERSHGKNPAAALRSLLSDINLANVAGVAVTGRLSGIVEGLPLPSKAALRKGLTTLHPELDSATVLSIGAHGFCVLELHENGHDYYCQNARCSQGTGNFLGQLVERFGLSVSEASRLCDKVEDPCALSGRCPVILKTDMTHLANKGEDRARILAGLFDAVCENVTTLIRSRFAPTKVVLLGGVSRSPRIRRHIGQWLETRNMTLEPTRTED